MRLTNKQKEFLKKQAAVMHDIFGKDIYLETTVEIKGSTLLLPENRPALEYFGWLDLVPSLEPDMVYDFPAKKAINPRVILTDYFVNGITIEENGENVDYHKEEAVLKAIELHVKQAKESVSVMDELSKAAKNPAPIAEKLKAEMKPSVGAIGKVIKMGGME